MDDMTAIELPPIDEAVIGHERLMLMLPHRYPFLMLDRVLDVRYGHSCVGIKNVTFNEPFFQGHFPGHPVMPGVLVIEAMAQAAAALVIATMGEQAGENPITYFMAIESAKFRRKVVPGDQLRLHMVKDRRRGNVWRYNGTATVDDNVVAEALLTAMIVPKGELR
jgi:3-hydroxyacyl-[acyl-carrier-protein] dehydratase